MLKLPACRQQGHKDNHIMYNKNLQICRSMEKSVRWNRFWRPSDMHCACSGSQSKDSWHVKCSLPRQKAAYFPHIGHIQCVYIVLMVLIQESGTGLKQITTGNPSIIRVDTVQGLLECVCTIVIFWYAWVQILVFFFLDRILGFCLFLLWRGWLPRILLIWDQGGHT